MPKRCEVITEKKHAAATTDVAFQVKHSHDPHSSEKLTVQLISRPR